jgi:AAHS family 4-hydroxybenzoate transporter-like MFS transporter
MPPRDDASAFDVARAIDEGGWNGFQKRVLVLAALAFAVDGLATLVIGLAIPALIEAWHAPKSAFAPIAAAGLIGVAIGSTLGGMLGDRVGRRIGLIGSVLLFGVMTLATAAVNDASQLLVLRFIAGLGIGGAIPNGAALIAEFTPLRRRSLAIALGMLFIPVGGLLSGLLGTVILPTLGWRGLFLVSGLLPIALGVAFLLILPESPRFLARAPLRHEELRRLLARFGLNPASNASLIDSAGARHHTHLAALFGSATRRDTLALWVGFFFCLLANYSMLSWFPTLLLTQGFPLAITSLGLTVFNLGGVAGGVLGGWLIGRFGSRISVPALAAGSAAGALALGVLPFDPGHGVIEPVLMLIIEGVFIAGLHTGLYTLAAHVYPPFAKATGVGTASTVGRIGAVFSSYTGVLSMELGGQRSYFIVIAGAVTISLLGIAFMRTHIPAGARAAGNLALNPAE